MYLRERNRDQAALQREAEVLARINQLEKELDSQASERDARIRLELSSHYVWRGHYRRAIELIQPLIELPFPNDIHLAARQAIGDAHFRHDQYDWADRLYRENLEIATSLGDEYWIARANDGLGWVYVEVGHHTTGEFFTAKKSFDASLPIYRRLGRKIAEAMAIQGLSRSVAGYGDYDGAVKYALEALTMLRENGGDQFIQIPLTQLAMVYRDNGNFERSRPYFEEALNAADRNQDPFGQVNAALGYGVLLQFLGEKEEARQMVQAVQPLIERHEFARLGHESNSRLALLAEDRGDFEEAYKRQKLCQQYGNRIGVISPILNNQQLILRQQIDEVNHLKHALEYLTAGVEASADAVFVLSIPLNSLESRDLIIQFVNSAAAELVSRTPRQLMQTLVHEAWKSEGIVRLLDLSDEVIRDGMPRSVDSIKLEFPGREGRSYSVKLVRIFDGVAWTISDVTEREGMEQEIREANERLVALDREKSEMLGIAAHDLRSPIGNIYSICELIPEQEPETEDLLNLIRGISHSLLGLLSNLLDIHRIERGEFNMQIEPVDIADSIEQVTREVAARASQKRIRIFTSSHGTMGFGLADRASLHQVVENLISNALKFSPPESTVRIVTATCADRVRVEVRDEGPGISESDQRKLFGRFAKLSALPTAGEPSTGLGLSIVKRLVEAMDGEIGCDSELGSGATFWFELPRFAR